MLRYQVLHFMTVNVDIILHKCDIQLWRIYAWDDPEEAKTSGSFTYKEYLSYGLCKGSWEDQVVCEGMLMLWQMMILNGPSCT